ncbi:MAG: hypothetical protein ACOC7T_00105 [Planctomycetota bacterium]
MSGGHQLPAVGREALSTERADLLEMLHRFTAERTAAAERGRAAVLRDGPEASACLHAFLRECWEALDGLGREVNLCMHSVFPGAGLYEPLEMTRQCTFYMVRKILRENPRTRDHPVARLLWYRTRKRPGAPYRRLSFLYNLSLFFPVSPVDEKTLPGTAEIHATARRIVKPQSVEACDLDEGLAQIHRWLAEFLEECYGRLADALREGPPTR